MSIHLMGSYAKLGGLVVSVLRCGRSDPGSSTGLDIQNFAKQISGRGSTHTQTIAKQLTLLKSMKK